MAGEQLLLINPRRRKRRKNPVRHHRRSRSRRRVANPRRRRHVVRAHSAVRRHRRYSVRRHMSNPRRRRQRRNPFSTGNLTQDLLMPAALGVVGGAALGIAWNSLASNLPTSITQNSIGSLLAEAAGAVGLGWIAGKALGQQKGTAVAVGALVVVGYNFLETTISGMALPTNFGAVRRRVPMGAYLPGQGLGAVGLRVPGRMGAYMPGQGLGAVSRFNPAPMMSGLGGKFCNPGCYPANPGMSNDSMF